MIGYLSEPVVHSCDGTPWTAIVIVMLLLACVAFLTGELRGRLRR